MHRLSKGGVEDQWTYRWQVLPVTISHVRSHDKPKKKKKKKKKKKILSIYLNNKGRHEVSDVELLIVLPFKKPFNIGKTTPP